jgi:hypothetical protein
MIKINGTSGITNVDGTAASPALTGADTDTGVFTGTDIVGISTGGTERVRVDASGNVGVGTSSPSEKLTVESSSDVAIRVGKSGIDSTRMGVDTVGWVGVGGALTFRTNGYTSASERARIDSSGNLLVGKTTTATTTQGIQIAPNGEIFISRVPTDQTLRFYNASTGAQVGSITVGASTTAYNTSSDYRLKHDIQPMTGALDKVAQLKPVTYKWNADDSQSQGFIAHELQEVVPECVTGEKDAVDAEGKPVYQGIDTSFLVATLTAAIKELKSELDAAKARIEQLEQA